MTEPAAADPKTECRHGAGVKCSWLVLGGAVLLSLPLAWVWLLIERNAGDTAAASFRHVTLEFDESLTLAPESDGIALRVAGLDISKAAQVSIEPCPLAPSPCVIRHPGGTPVDVSLEPRMPIPEGVKLRFLPGLRVRPNRPDASNCRTPITFSGRAPSEAALSLQAGLVPEGCWAALETTLQVEVPANVSPVRLGLNLQSGAIDGHPGTRQLELSCSGGATETTTCTFAINAKLTAGTVANYVLRDDKPAIVLRGTEEAELPLAMLSGELAAAEARNTTIAACRDLPGDNWEVTAPKLRQLLLGAGDPGTLRATLRDYDGVSCTRPWKDFWLRWFAVLGLPTLFKLFGEVRLRSCITCSPKSPPSAAEKR